MAVTLGSARQITHEFIAQSDFDFFQDIALDRLHVQHAIDALERKIVRQGRQDPCGMIWLNFG